MIKTYSLAKLYCKFSAFKICDIIIIMEAQISKLDIFDYIRLYSSGLSLDKIRPLKNQTYSVFSRNSKKIRLISRKEVYKTPLCFEKIKYFVNNNEYFYMVPIETIKGTIVGFILRGVFTSNYSTISRVFNNPLHQVRLMYGFDEQWVKFDKEKKCCPIVVCEGCKDCLSLKKVYPYVLSNNTSSMGINAYILRNISDKFILAYDNDEAGKDGMKKDKEILRNMGAYVDSLKLPEGIKDCTDLIYTSQGMFKKKEFLFLREQLTKKLKSLYNSV